MDTKQKILYVITQGEWGGAERYVFDLATNLEANFDVTVAVGEPNGRQDLQNKLDKIGRVHVLQLTHLVRRISPYHDVLAIFELARLYKKLRPDIVHLNSSKTGFIGSLAKKLLPAFYSPRVIYTVHGWVFNEPLPWLRKKTYFYSEKLTAKLKDGFIALSLFEAEQGKTLLKIPSNKITVIPHGVTKPTAPLSQTEARGELLKKTNLKISEKNIWIGTIANYYKTKGLDILIQALAKKRNALQNVSCLLIGEGPERTKLTQLIAANHLDNLVYLTGSVPEAARFLPAFDLFVLPSRKEGLPYSLLEATTAGVPVVATAVGGVPTIVTDKKTGLLVPPENSPALADAIEYGLSHLAELRPTTPPQTLQEEIKHTTSWYQLMLQIR